MFSKCKCRCATTRYRPAQRNALLESSVSIKTSQDEAGTSKRAKSPTAGEMSGCELGKCLCPNSNWPVRGHESGGNLEPVALTNPRSRFTPHILFLSLSPSCFSLFSPSRLVPAPASRRPFRKKKVLFLSPSFSQASTVFLPHHLSPLTRSDTMASTRVLASRLASQMAPKVARPALRVQVAKRTITSKFSP